jgi:hypothetical protein
MKKAMVISLSLLFLLPISAFGFDFMFSDFGTNPFDYNNNWSPIAYPNGIGHLPSPGYFGEGGEKFDLEGLFANMDLGSKMLNLALTKSFGQTVYSTGWGQLFNAGDIFIDFSTGERFAIDVSTGHLWRVGNAFGISDRPGTYYGNEAIRNAVGAFLIDQNKSTDLGAINSKETFLHGEETGYLSPGDGNTWVWEYALSTDKFNLGRAIDNSEQIFVHNTLECGNDYIEGRFSSVPEPSTWILFGSGLFGFRIFTRSRKKMR